MGKQKLMCKLKGSIAGKRTYSTVNPKCNNKVHAMGKVVQVSQKRTEIFPNRTYIEKGSIPLH